MRNRSHSGTVSLARALSKLGYCSRSQAIQLILDGRITVHGRVLSNPSYRCIPEKTDIAVDGIPVQKEHYRYIVMNKPIGIVTTRSDERGRNTVYHLLGEIGQWVFPVGRLDKDSSGLLIFTNDTRFGERLTSPETKISKVYEVTVDKDFIPEDRKKFESGISVDGEIFQPATVKILGPRTMRMTIVEGKNRQIRRMCEAVGYRVITLARIKIGGLTVTDLEPGAWRDLTAGEIDKLSYSSKD